MNRERISVTLPPDVLRAADTRAAVERRSRSWVVTEALAAFTRADPEPEQPGPPAALPGQDWLVTFDRQEDYLRWKARDPTAHAVTPFRDRLAEVCAALARTKARYLLMGSAALMLLGASRSHAGLELLVHPSKKNLRRVLEAVSSLGSPLAHEALAKSLSRRGVVVFGETPRVDLLTLAGKLTYKEARERASSVGVEGAEVQVGFIGDVVDGGVAWNRAQAPSS